MGFSVAEPFIENLLLGIQKGEIQLPEFQRGWVWDDTHIKSLLTSLTLSYPIGAIMTLEAGGVPFKPRLFEGVVLQPAPSPTKLVLDGQQRLTSLFLAMKSGLPVKTRNEKGVETKRVYFLDMSKCLDPQANRDEAVVSVPDTLKVTSDFGRFVELDLSTQELQYKNRMFPISIVFDDKRYIQWKVAFLEYYNNSTEAIKYIMEFEQEIWLRFKQFKVPQIELTRDTPIEAVCQIFEKVNTGGVTLTVFELMTATFAASSFNLRDDWNACHERLTRRHNVLNAIDGTSFLTAVTLLSNYEAHLKEGSAISCKRTDVLRLKIDSYILMRNRVEEGLKKAAELLASEKVFDERSLPYATQLIPMACIIGHDPDVWDRFGSKQKLLQWFWCGVFGELYGSANETRYASDLVDVIQWVNGGSEPRTVRDSSFSPIRLLSLQSRLSAAYKGLAALLMKEGSKDFISGTEIDINTYFNNAIDIHHIFPQAWCEANGLPRDKWNSVINKTPLSSSTNRFIGGDAPSRYLYRIERNRGVSSECLDELVSSHKIPIRELRSDSFEEFLRVRASMLLDAIEEATGKVIDGRDSDDVVKAFGNALL